MQTSNNHSQDEEDTDQSQGGMAAHYPQSQLEDLLIQQHESESKAEKVKRILLTNILTERIIQTCLVVVMLILLVVYLFLGSVEEKAFIGTIALLIKLVLSALSVIICSFGNYFILIGVCAIQFVSILVGDSLLFLIMFFPNERVFDTAVLIPIYSMMTLELFSLVLSIVMVIKKKRSETKQIAHTNNTIPSQQQV
ncbi:predicted protein [Naegleria gruberi]|uniref:Predicted protein n=1 Tax=Naegleria gruberi TaxID=5762 RepID=D2VUA5_NAEGR|nr:uncharacterized protein NAEGRDRAFT_72592 [Naegleria gruberi]EFC39656.1 predicted protein [Naegleria gruberi]|eukprot:XP_002672400.1 predicted protein [Naegleria gruberi strain NEG-M]